VELGLWLVIIDWQACATAQVVVGWQAESSLGEEKSMKSGSNILHFVIRPEF
jgi:hypothetical protein